MTKVDIKQAQSGIFSDLGKHQWYVHLSRNSASANLDKVKTEISNLVSACESKNINLVVGFGPDLLKDLGAETPDDFQPFTTIKSIDDSGKEAAATQEDLLFWLHSDSKDDIWKAQYDARTALASEMSVARETMAFIYGASLDMTGFIDGTGNPAPEDQPAVAMIPEGEPAAGGSFILAQRWVHDLEGWNKMSVPDQEKAFGRTKADSVELETQEPYSHLSHVAQADQNHSIARRSTPYAFHDGTVGLYFMAFCKSQSPFVEMLNAMYGTDGQVRDKITDFSDPVSGAFYFSPSVSQLSEILGG